MIFGVGFDLVEIDRMEAAIKRWGDRILSRVYSAGEIEYCGKRPFPPQHFAARFAAKEAFMKSVGVGIFRGIAFKDVEVCVQKTGKPGLNLHGGAHDLMLKSGIAFVHLSLTHSERYAAAVVILE